MTDDEFAHAHRSIYPSPHYKTKQKYKIQNTKYKIQNTKYKIQNTKRRPTQRLDGASWLYFIIA
jgi:hypothetical protein